MLLETTNAPLGADIEDANKSLHNLKTVHLKMSSMSKVQNLSAEFIMLSFNYLFMVKKSYKVMEG